MDEASTVAGDSLLEEAHELLISVGTAEDDIHTRVTTAQTRQADAHSDIPFGRRLLVLVLELDVDVQATCTASEEKTFVLAIEIDEDIPLREARL